MRNCILIVFLFFSAMVFAQTKVSDKAHKAKVTESALKKNATVSRDSLYCSGNLKAMAVSVEENLILGTEAKAIYLPGGKDVLILVDKQSYKNPEGKLSYYYQIDFPGLQMSCDVRENDKAGNPYDQICKYELINEYGLDTNKVFVFATLKGKIPQNELLGQWSHKDTVIMMRSIIAPRNIKAPLNITDENLYQDGVMFGSYVQDTLDGQFGKVKHFQIYNSKGVLICTATETKMNSHQWRLLCYRDNKFQSLAFNDDSDLKHILEFLIREQYL